MIANVNLAHFTDRRELFTNRIPLSSVRTVLTDRQTVYNHSCHENIQVPLMKCNLRTVNTLYRPYTPFVDPFDPYGSINRI